MSDNKNNQTDSKNVILKDEQQFLLDHDYDGIQELDHPLPNWWLAILYGTIVFSIFYAGYYLTGVGPGLRDELNVALAQIDSKKAEAAAAAPANGGLTNEALIAAAADPTKVAAGKAVFDGKCAACHAPDGGGLIGPNLTDDHWLHGSGSPVDIAGVVRDGVAEKGMPPWGPVLTPEELFDVTAFIRSLHGTKPANPKEPQGDLKEFTSL